MADEPAARAPHAVTRYRRAFRYARAWARPPHNLIETERGAATLYRPAEPRAPLPAWIVLHGITVPGRRHPMLVRFARALASTGAAVVVPEVREWVALRLAPDCTDPTVRGALDLLADEPGVAQGRRGLVGFSFGAPQAIRVGAAMPDEIAGTVAFGGYCDLERTLRFQLTGHHEWQGVTRRLRPDPYGRWIVAGNYLRRVPGYEDAGPVAEALLELARTAGEHRVPAWNAVYDPVKESLAAALPADQRALFRMLAPESARDPLEPDDEVLAWADRFAAAARREDPLVDALQGIDRLPSPVHVLHGRADVLIPWTEALRLAEALEPRGPVRASVTGLFAHSNEHALRGLVNSAREAVGFFRALAGMLGVVRIVAFLGLALGSVACQEAPSDGRVDGQDAPARALSELRQLTASDTGATAFGRVIDVAFGDGGHVFVADAQADEVRVFNRTGAHVTSWGRTGEGPGEFGYVSGIALDPDETLWVMDALNQRLTGFTSNGDTLTLPGLQEGWSATIPWLGRFANNGDLLDFVIEGADDGTTRRVVERARVGAGGLERVVRTALPPFEPERYERQRGGIRELATVPFAPERKLVIAPDGTIWINDEAAYVVHRIGPRGDTLRTVRVPGPPPRLTRAQRDSASRASGVGLSRIPEHRPWIERLLADSQGRLWVIRSDRTDRWDVWQADGERETVAVPVPYDARGLPPEVVGDTVVGVVVDALGRQSVVVSVLRSVRPTARSR